jgi:hypothetical protein
MLIQENDLVQSSALESIGSASDYESEQLPQKLSKMSSAKIDAS